MKFYDTVTAQHLKKDQTVCGDHYLCDKAMEGTLYILSDGIGSGIYANIAAISCASRLREHLRMGASLRTAAEMVAASMHKARTQRIPFAAFSAVWILADGSFDVYTYEAPEAILIRNGFARVLKPSFYSAGYEVVGEYSGTLEIGDSLVLSSDGVTQAGLGHGYGFGIGVSEVAEFISHYLAEGRDIYAMPEEVSRMCASISAGNYEDDTTCALIHCRPATEITVLTGPPAQMNRDKECVQYLMSMSGTKVVCGSTTADIVARELQREVEITNMGSTSFTSPPEYKIEGIDLTTEGAVMLNQVFNLLGEPPDEFEDGVVERFCAMLVAADAIHFIIGGSVNEAHTALIFKQMGVMPRKQVVELIINKLRAMGKLVTVKAY